MRRPISLGVLLALCLATGCASTIDVTGARRMLDAPTAAAEIRRDAVGTLPAVEGLRTLSGELRAIALRWQPVLAGPVSGYVIERAPAEDAEFGHIAVVGGAFVTTWVDRGPSGVGLEDGRTYHYRVRAVDRDGALGALHAPVAGATAPLPDRPRGVRAISQLPRRVALSWDPSPDPTVAGYRILRSPSALGEFLPVSLLEGRFTTTWVDEGLGDLRVFHYRVAAVNAAGGVGDASAPERAVTKPEPLPPDGVEAVAQALGRNRIAWRPNVEPDLAGYRVSRISDGETDEVAVLPREVTEFVDDGLGAGETVAYTVHAFDRDGLVSGAAGPFVVESVDYSLRAGVTAEGVVLSWDPGAQADLAETRILSVGRLSREELGRTLEARFLDENAPPGRRRYQLVGVRSDGSEAPASAPIDVQVPLPEQRIGSGEPRNGG